MSAAQSVAACVAGRVRNGACQRCNKPIPAKNASGKRRKWCGQKCRQRQQKRCRSATGQTAPPTSCTVCARTVQQGRTKWRYFCSAKCQVYASRARRGVMHRRPSRLDHAIARQPMRGLSDDMRQDMRQEMELCRLEGREFDRRAFLAQNMPWQESVELDERIHF